MKTVLLILRVIFGGLFIFAAVLKLRDPQTFFDAIMAFKILPAHLARLATFALPWTELLAGAALIVGYQTRSAAALLSTMLVAFLLGILSAIQRDLDLTCACFGKLEVPCKGPVGMCHVVRNAVLIAMGLTIAAFGAGKCAVEGRRPAKGA